MTARDTAVTVLAEVLADTASWANHGIPVDEYRVKVAGRVVDAIIAAVQPASEASDEANPYVGWDEEPDDDTLDEFIAKDVESVHFEALDDCRWYANVKLNDGQLWTLNFGSVTGRAKGYANAEQVE